MQASSVPAQAERASTPGRANVALTRDMYALMNHLMRNSHVETFDLIAELDLSFTQIKALCAMDLDREDRSVKGLAESMHVSLPAMSRAVDGLHARGFVDRDEDPSDRRMKRVRLTEPGQAIASSLTKGRLAGVRGFLDSLSDEEAAALARALVLIVERHPELAELRPPLEATSKAGES
jgi:DNA-binding MarR family transcriptional regulator